MFITTNNCDRGRQSRRGVVLLVVITMLALFAALGLSFVYYAQSEADAANMSTQAQTQNTIDIDPEFLLSYSLGQLLYGVNDISEYGNNNNVYSALRGHDLARNIYGWNRYALNVTPFNGVPRTAVPGPDPQVGQPYANLVNRQYFPGDGPLFNQPEFILDPDRYGANRTGANLLTQGPPAGQFYVGHNVPWTYADTNNMYLGQINGTGQVLIQSFWRDWTITGASLDPNNALWSTTVQPPAWQKYATLRPLPWYNRGDGVRGFPAPADRGGDVKNLDFAQGFRYLDNTTTPPTVRYSNNDSIWIDLGFPVRVGPNGQRYKPLFAFFIMDLDGKVNLNVAGNLRRQQNGNYEHGSNLGLGPWEINPQRVLNDISNDWRGVLHHRYDQTYLPGQAANAQNTTPGNPGWFLPPGMVGAPPFYAFMDFDGVRDPASNYATSEPIYLPGNPNNTYTATNGRLIQFPFVPATSYGGGSAVERTTHPALFNPINPNNGGADDRLHRLSELEALYRYGGTGSPSLTAKLFRLAPLNFQAQNSRLNVTLLSADLARPGITPWLLPTTSAYQLNAPMGILDAFPNVGGAGLPASVPPASPNAGEYGQDYRGFAGAGKRLNVNRTLRNYPAPGNNGLIDMTANGTAYNNAVQDRQQLARDIFDYLRFVTTGARPGAPITDAPASPEFSALRWLAQLAVNIVDFRDIDEYNTAFSWTPGEYVYGTELPQVVVNEVYAEIVNDPNDPGVQNNTMATLPYKANFWLELLNPLMNAQTLDPAASPYPTDPNGVKSNTAILQNPNGATPQNPTGAVYKLQIVEPPANGSAIDVNDPANVLGVTNPANVRLQVEDFAPAPPGNPTDPFDLDPAYHYVVNAVHTNTGPPPQPMWPTKMNRMMVDTPYHPNNGFYVMGPHRFEFPPNTMAPTNPVTVRIADRPAMGMNPPHGLTRDLPLMGTNPAMVPNHSVVLRRLACPHLPAQTDPTFPAYNPFVTVDYLDNIPIRNGVEFDAAGRRVGNDRPTPLGLRASVARQHPYRARPLVDSPPGGGPPPRNSMFSHNNLNATFEWLVHLDRNYTSPAELLHVSGYRPFQLTQQFYDAAGTNAHSHRAPFAPNATTTAAQCSAARIYRFLEYVDTGYRMAGVSHDGRVPGKININTLWGTGPGPGPANVPAVFRALCDQNASVNFSSDDVNTIWYRIRASRSSDNDVPGSGDRPFRSLTAAYEGAANDGINATILRGHPVGSDTPLFRVPTVTHPQQQNELISKIFNNVTTRSNVFAVWLTVGFFEVHEWPNNPQDLTQGMHYELGKEIGKDENRHIRHRMFSIVDRTELVLPNTSGAYGNFRNVSANFVANPNQLVVPAPPTTYPAQPTDQIPLEVTYQNATGGIVTDMIIATLTGANANSWTFDNVPLPLNANQVVLVTLRGNPGPQLRFDHRLPRYAPVVPYYSIIQ